MRKNSVGQNSDTTVHIGDSYFLKGKNIYRLRWIFYDVTTCSWCLRRNSGISTSSIYKTFYYDLSQGVKNNYIFWISDPFCLFTIQLLLSYDGAQGRLKDRFFTTRFGLQMRIHAPIVLGGFHQLNGEQYQRDLSKHTLELLCVVWSITCEYSSRDLTYTGASKNIYKQINWINKFKNLSISK